MKIILIILMFSILTCYSQIKDNNLITKTLMNKNINTNFDEYLPLIDIKNQKMYFSSRNPESENNEDVYEIETNFEDQFSNQSIKLPYPINTKANESMTSINKTGDKCIIFRPDPILGHGELFFANLLENGQWSNPIKFGLNINSEFNETTACFGADDNTIFFTSDRPGGYGGLDIYISIKKKNGSWGSAKNLGRIINTSKNEETPYWNQDEDQLIFSSQGKEINLGGYDLFKSKYIDNIWQESENLGSIINTEKNDLSIVFLNEKRAFYSSFSKESNSYDLYQLDFK